LDGTENKQDVNTSAEETETSEEKPQTVTTKERDKAVSDALSAAGRDAKAMEAREKAVKDALSQAEKLQADIKTAEDDKAERDYQEALSNAGDDPLAKSKVELTKTIRDLKLELGDTKSKLGKRDEELTETRKVVAESTKERNAREIASKYEVNADTLKLTDGSVESMEALAKSISGKETPTLKLDTGETKGGKGIPTDKAAFEKWFANLSEEDFEKNAPQINKMRREGKIK